MKRIVDFILYFFLGISKKRKAKKMSRYASGCVRISETNEIVPGEGYDLFPHIDFTFER